MRAAIAILQQIQRYDPGITTDHKIQQLIPPLRILAAGLNA